MKRIYLSLIIFLIMTFVFNVSPPVSDTMAQQPTGGESEMKVNIGKWSPTQKELWRLEEIYWTRLKSGDVDSMKILWHEKFVGWPSHSAEPVDLTGTRASLAKLRDLMTIIAYKLQPQAVMIHGNIAVIHYVAEISSEDKNGKRQTVPFRITHTWINEQGKWKILGVMSAE